MLELSQGAAEVLESNGERVVLRTSAPSPPGSVLRCRDRGPAGSAATHYTVKVRSCRRENGAGSGSFVVEGRFVNLSRAVREQLLLTLAARVRNDGDPG